ncbi:hypothetical protein CSUB01_10926 [Colletotrichum sublineola]|uniref:Uncharacterized protein n=1 Tax=Colletotrichum sublineola TaxID=1173701 RepID=A0A066XT12_COLSU|nr:hypothetical protein CSUB01_10926 [Colletotrichum sublineola]
MWHPWPSITAPDARYRGGRIVTPLCHSQFAYEIVEGDDTDLGPIEVADRGSLIRFRRVQSAFLRATTYQTSFIQIRCISPRRVCPIGPNVGVRPEAARPDRQTLAHQHSTAQHSTRTARSVDKATIPFLTWFIRLSAPCSTCVSQCQHQGFFVKPSESHLEPSSPVDTPSKKQRHGRRLTCPSPPSYYPHHSDYRPGKAPNEPRSATEFNSGTPFTYGHALQIIWNPGNTVGSYLALRVREEAHSLPLSLTHTHTPTHARALLHGASATYASTIFCATGFSQLGVLCRITLVAVSIPLLPLLLSSNFLDPKQLQYYSTTVTTYYMQLGIPPPFRLTTGQ